MKVRLEKVFETETFDSGFQKRVFIAINEENPQYPQFLKFELLKDACTKIDVFKVGQLMDVEFNIRGSKYENPTKGTQYFVSLQAWKISGGEQAPNEANTPKAEQEWLNSDGDADDLPFILTLLIASSFLLQMI